MPSQNELQSSCLSLGKTLFDAIHALNGRAEGMAIIIGHDDKVIGVLTDGDMRRAIVKEGRLDALIDAYVQRDFISVSEAETRNQVLDLLQANKIKHLPILNRAGSLVGIHQINDIVGGDKLPNHAVIMAGGKGVRLRPITETLPKPMIPVAGRPILERLVLHLVGCGIINIHIAVNYLAEVIVRHFGDGNRFGCEISYMHETEELGTGGALSLLPAIPEDPIIVLNGDLVTQLDFASMLAFHTASHSVATIGYQSYLHQVPYGCLDIRDDTVLGLQEKPVLERFINAGVYILSPATLKLVPKRFFPITQLFQTILDNGKKVSSYEITTDWTDVGQHRELNKARGHSD